MLTWAAAWSLSAEAFRCAALENHQSESSSTTLGRLFVLPLEGRSDKVPLKDPKSSPEGMCKFRLTKCSYIHYERTDYIHIIRTAEDLYNTGKDRLVPLFRSNKIGELNGVQGNTSNDTITDLVRLLQEADKPSATA